ncbi:MAG: isoprenylcysteine carboxylmethyltransferase family protein [Acidobacteriota bacterium]
MRRYWFPKRYAHLAARLRVPGGFALAAAFAWLSEPAAFSLAVGIPVAALGLLLRGWAAGHLAKNERLATSGPYAYTRNPLYLGTLVVALGLAIASRRWLLAVLFAAVFGLLYLPVIEREEQHLRRLFPAYDDYARRAPLLWPRRGRQPARGDGFRWQLYFKNQEYQPLLGFLCGILFLAWKVWH